MIERYLVVAGRIRQELTERDQVVARAERAIAAAHERAEDHDLYLDSVALNLHDFYGGLERIFHHIATAVDGSVPSGRQWHRELLRQMGVAVPRVRPPVLSAERVQRLDEYLRFRHVVRNVYAFAFDVERLERLTQRLRPAFEQVRSGLLAFADLLEHVAREESDAH